MYSFLDFLFSLAIDLFIIGLFCSFVFYLLRFLRRKYIWDIEKHKKKEDDKDETGL